MDIGLIIIIIIVFFVGLVAGMITLAIPLMKAGAIDWGKSEEYRLELKRKRLKREEKKAHEEKERGHARDRRF